MPDKTFLATSEKQDAIVTKIGNVKTDTEALLNRPIGGGGSKVYDISGSYSFNIPEVVNTILVTIFGAGGGGASGTAANITQSNYYYTGFGGKGGTVPSTNTALLKVPLDVHNARSIPVIVGAGGMGGAGVPVPTAITSTIGRPGGSGGVTSVGGLLSVPGGSGGGGTDGYGTTPEGSVKNGVSGNVTPFPVTPGFNTIQTATRYVAESIGGEGGLSQDAPTPGKPGSGISAGGGGGGGANKYTSGLSGAGGKGSDGFVLIEW